MNTNQEKIKSGQDNITRKEAVEKMCKYASLTAIGTFLILSPQHAQSMSPPDAGGDFF